MRDCLAAVMVVDVDVERLQRPHAHVDAELEHRLVAEVLHASAGHRGRRDRTLYADLSADYARIQAVRHAQRNVMRAQGVVTVRVRGG